MKMMVLIGSDAILPELIQEVQGLRHLLRAPTEMLRLKLKTASLLDYSAKLREDSY